MANVLGTVSNVSAESITLDTKSKGFKKPGSSKTYSCNAQTKVTKDDAVVTMAEVQAGDVVTLKESGGVATRIAVHEVDDDNAA